MYLSCKPQLTQDVKRIMKPFECAGSVCTAGGVTNRSSFPLSPHPPVRLSIGTGANGDSGELWTPASTSLCREVHRGTQSKENRAQLPAGCGRTIRG